MNAIIISGIWGVLMMLGGVFLKRQLAVFMASLGMVLVLIADVLELNSGLLLADFNTANLLNTGSLSLIFIAVSAASTLVFFLLSGNDVLRVGPYAYEYFALIFFSFSGLALCCTFNNMIMLFLGVEIMSIPLYVLTGADKRNLKSNEAAIKYFLMGAFSTGIMLMGMAFIYGANPAASFFINEISITTAQLPVLMSAGLVMVLASFAFKVSAAPFHFWTPDVYDGAPTVFTSFMSTIIKGAGFFAFIRTFESIFGLFQHEWQILVIVMTLATLLIGNITAVFQQSVKRLLAYSSIAQAGFMMLALFAMNERGKEGIVLYAAAYSLATIGMFAVLLRMDDYTVDGFNGLSKRNPLLAFCSLVFLLSLTGVPLTAGFQAKFWMIAAAIENGHHFWVVPVAIVFAAVAAYYYFRVIQAMYFKDAADNVSVLSPVSKGFASMLMLCAFLILLLGVYPEFILGWIYH